MTIRYRKSFGSKGSRVTLSKSGVGWSVGAKGARISKKAGGGYRASVGGGGVYSVNDYGGVSRNRRTRKKKKSGCLVWLIIMLSVFGLVGALASCSPEETPEQEIPESTVEQNVESVVPEAPEPEEINPTFLDPYGGNNETPSADNDSAESDNDSAESDNENRKSEVVYRTETGEKYHRKGCRHLSESCIEITLEQATQAGLTPCGTCH